MRDEATRRRQQSSTVEALRPPRDREFVISEMGLHRHVTGTDKDPDEVYGTGEEDEARFIGALRALAMPTASEEKEVVEPSAPVSTAPEPEKDMPDDTGESTQDVDMGDDASQEPSPRLDDVEADIVRAEQGQRSHDGKHDGPREERNHVDDGSGTITQEQSGHVETPFETPFESFNRLSIAGLPNGAGDHAAPIKAGNGHVLEKHDVAVEDTQDDEVFGSCGERI